MVSQVICCSAVLGFLGGRLFLLFGTLHKVGSLGGDDLPELLPSGFVGFADLLPGFDLCAHLGHIGALDMHRISYVFVLPLSLSLTLSLSWLFMVESEHF